MMIRSWVDVGEATQTHCEIRALPNMLTESTHAGENKNNNNKNQCNFNVRTGHGKAHKTPFPSLQKVKRVVLTPQSLISEHTKSDTSYAHTTKRHLRAYKK